MTDVQQILSERTAYVRSLYQSKLDSIGSARERFTEILDEKLSTPAVTVNTASASAPASSFPVASGASQAGDSQSLMSTLANMMAMQSMTSAWSADGSGSSGGSSDMSGMMSMMLMTKLIEQIGALTPPAQTAAAPAAAQVRDTEPDQETPVVADILESAAREVETPYDGVIEQAAARFNLPSTLIKGVIQAESSFREGIVSNKGAQGLMQLMPGTAEELGVTDVFDPEQNIMGGSAYLRKMLDRFAGDVKLALAAYNSGPNSVRAHGVTSSDAPEYGNLSTRVRAYVDRVLDYADGFANG